MQISCKLLLTRNPRTHITKRRPDSLGGKDGQDERPHRRTPHSLGKEVGDDTRRDGSFDTGERALDETGGDDRGDVRGEGLGQEEDHDAMMSKCQLLRDVSGIMTCGRGIGLWKDSHERQDRQHRPSTKRLGDGRKDKRSDSLQTFPQRNSRFFLLSGRTHNWNLRKQNGDPRA